MAGRVVVVGAGPAGVRAAETLARAGERPLVLDRAAAPGGQIYRRQPEGFTRSPADLYGADAAKAEAIHRVLGALGERVEYRREVEVWGISDDCLHVHDGTRLERIGFDALILATGATDRVVPVAGWTLPGVYSLGGAQIALKAQGCAIGQRVAFLGSGPLLTLVAWQYAKAGAEVAAVLETARWRDQLAGASWLAARPGLLRRGLALRADLARWGVPVHLGVRAPAIEGEGAVDAVTWRDRRGRPRRVACDAVGLGWHLRSETQLAELAGCDFAWDGTSRQHLPTADAMGRSSRPGIYLAGDGARLLGADGAEVAGRLAALACLEDRGRASDPQTRRLLRQRRRMARFATGLARAFPAPARLAAATGDGVLLCRCEAVTAGAYRETLRRSGAGEPNRAKSLSRAGMGRCQGRFCGFAAAEILAAERGAETGDLPALRMQAPVRPLPMGLLPEGEAKSFPSG